MKCPQGIVTLAGALAITVVSAAHGQTAADTTHRAADSTVVQPKHGGMFGKMKGLAKNKTAQAIAKAAVCTAVPGGQFVVAAVDAKQSKSAAGAASSVAGAAAGAAAGVAGGVAGAPGAGCMPGMGGLGAGVPGLGAAGKMGGIPSAAGVAMGMTGAAATGMPAGMPGMPGGGTMTAASMATMTAQMQAMAAQMQGANATAADVPTEAPGEQPQLSGDPSSELAKGKLVIKHIDWMRQTPGVSASATPAFIDAMKAVGAAMKQLGGSFRVDVYTDKRYSDAEAESLGPQRIATVISVLQDAAQLGDAAQMGKWKKDKEQRVEIVKIK